MMPLNNPRPADAHVPCDGCTACCKHVLIVLLPEHGDVVEAYRHFDCINPLSGEVAQALIQKPDGSCTYLGPAGCTIHGHAPVMCRVFDCRRFLLRFPDRAERRRLVRAGVLDAAIMKAGAARLHTLAKESDHGSL